MSRGGTLPGGTRAVTGSSAAVSPTAGDRARATGGTRRVTDAAGYAPVAPRRRATPITLLGWATLAAIVIAGQLLRTPAPAEELPEPALPASPDTVPPATASLAPAAAGSFVAVQPGPVGLLAFGLALTPRSASAAPASGTAPSAAPAPAPAAPVAPVAAAAMAAAATPKPRGAEERPLLKYLGGEHRFESPLLMPRLREGLRVKLPQVAKLARPQRLLARPRPGEPLPVLITAYCLKGTTRRGLPVRTGIIAADPHVFPLARHVELYAGGRFLGRFLVDDTGGKIRGPRIDIWTPDCDDATRFGARRGVATLVALSEVKRTRAAEHAAEGAARER